MVRRPQLLLGLVAALLLAAGAAVVLRGDEPTSGAAPTTTSTSLAGTTTTAEPVATTTTAPTTTTAAPISWPALPADGASRAVVTPNGVVLAVSSVLSDGRFEAVSPCGQAVAVTGQPLSGATVVIDPGHGGDEPGAVGPSGLTEKDVNLAVAQELQAQLQAQGATAVLTRTGDYRVTLASRGAIAQALHPAVFVSVHHNAAPDETRPTPGAETYFQIASAESKRLAGLAYEEVVAAFSAYPIQWAADFDAGAKYRPNSKGGDYYGILKRTAGIPAVLSEAAFITNAPEEALLADPAFRQVEAVALARAVVRFVTTADPGSGFVEPYPRTEPAGSGGGASGCQDPPLQ
ncbi:MAG TPA: N-acetylmuramoyl-L-alanine amidase [Acidimicrobiales bacterium]|nr:N-acetylmuramoyl-L-alanine amidase [Acidimicrobiales bacterium]